MGTLVGKTALVTGANRGIGRTIVEKIAQEGANIWACSRKYSAEFENEMEIISQKNDVKIMPLYFDITKEDEILEAVKTIHKSKDSINVLINVAGIANSSIFQMTSLSTFREVFEVNFFGTVSLTQKMLRLMTKNKSGSIINIASIAGIDVNPENTAYGTSKAALIHFTKILASEIVKTGIRVNAIAPGPTETDMIEAIKKSIGEDKYLERCAMGRCASTEEIAQVVIFLAGDTSSFINGQVIRVDGGSK